MTLDRSKLVHPLPDPQGFPFPNEFHSKDGLAHLLRNGGSILGADYWKAGAARVLIRRSYRGTEQLLQAFGPLSAVPVGVPFSGSAFAVHPTIGDLREIVRIGGLPALNLFKPAGVDVRIFYEAHEHPHFYLLPLEMWRKLPVLQETAMPGMVYLNAWLLDHRVRPVRPDPPLRAPWWRRLLARVAGWFR